ncbi:MAG: helix-turn-helix domain-containing protein [Acidobacteriota bacterium]
MEVRRVQCKRCGKLKREKLPWLANNPFHANRFSYYVGRKCRTMTIKDVAKELKLDWHAVKALDKEYML